MKRYLTFSLILLFMLGACTWVSAEFNLTGNITQAKNEISLTVSWEEVYNRVVPLALFLLGVVFYSVFIFKMYRFIASRDIFEEGGKYDNFKEKLKAEKDKGGIINTILNIIGYLLLFPFIVFLFFIFFFLLLIFLSKNPNINTVMLIAMAIVGAIRVTSYYSEDLSKDLAKLLPLALLGVYIVDISHFSYLDSLGFLLGALFSVELWILLIYYLVFIIALEFVLRILYFFYSHLFKKENSTVPETEN